MTIGVLDNNKLAFRETASGSYFTYYHIGMVIKFIGKKE